jgi:hypothetical protein
MTARPLLSSVGLMAVVSLALGACGSRTNLLCPSDVTLTPQTPNLYFVLDHSLSMRENGKWDSVKTAVSGLVTTIGTSARFGAAIFPNATSGGCDVGTEVMSVRPGDATAAAALLQAMAPVPAGGTPTAATLTSLVSELSALDGPTFAILATDGGPNCNGALTCDVDHCTANIDHVQAGCVQAGCNPGGTNCCATFPADCIDDVATVAAVTSLRTAGVPTYVIGVPGSEAYSEVLDGAAHAGGTAQANAATSYYRVDTSDAQALSGALVLVVQQVMSSCTMGLARSVGEQEANVFVGTTPVPKSDTDGFSLLSRPTGELLLLHGSACASAQAGMPVTLRVVDECPVR